MISKYRLKWSFIFCEFQRPYDKTLFLNRIKRKQIFYNKKHNMISTCSKSEREFIFKIQPKFATFTELQVTDKQFGMIHSYKKFKER